MGIWDKFFGKKTENKSEKSPYMPSEETPIDISFAETFTNKGGHFLFCESSKLVPLNLEEILKEFTKLKMNHLIIFLKKI